MAAVCWTLRILALALSFGSLLAVDWDVITNLDQYVQSDDGHYSWNEIASYNYEGVTVYIVNMTSQMYQSDSFSTQSIWWHFMGIAIPDNIRDQETGILFIDGGSNTNYNPPDRLDSSVVAMAGLARDTGLISSYIRSVPNQPIHFYNDPTFMRRQEDSIIAWTWRSFVDSPEPSDPTVILRMPMTKAAKRALDTITAVSQQRLPDSNVQKFLVLGASKRGWTTWSLAATDKRVIAIVPMVFSMINMGGGTLEQHFRNMDANWSFALTPYWRENLTQEFFNAKAELLWEVEDMWYFRERFTIPILEIVSSGDEFFLPDDNHNWWDGIPDPKYLMMLPNAEHTMAPHYLQIYESGVSFAINIIENKPMPSVTWTMEQTPEGGSILFKTDPPPVRVKAYRAVTLANDTRRDFRLAAMIDDTIVFHPVAWRQTLDILDLGGGEYRVNAENVPGEWVGFFVEGEWEGPTGYRLTLTSQVNIIPWTYPAELCTDPMSCWGQLV
jgi:PhoPQ-activated pathogenicity-related protein